MYMKYDILSEISDNEFRRKVMTSTISFNMGYNNNAYMFLPLNRISESGLTVKSSTPIAEPPKDIMNNLDDLRACDTNNDNILSLNELRNFNGKSGFAQTILEMMEKYARDFR